jgi:hypothetical protein
MMEAEIAADLQHTHTSGIKSGMGRIVAFSG